MMAALYPEIEPYESGRLAVGDGHQIYWECCGNPNGKPALVLHGGPGSGASAGARRLFDPDAYRVILVDQRGAGRSRPHASSPGIDLSTNTTSHLLADIEALRRHLGVETWLVLGGSWGSTLALLYGERHPDRVTELVLSSIATTTRREIDWITCGVGTFFPEAWARLEQGVPEHARGDSIVDAYAELLLDPDPAVHQKAARNWCDWEMAIVAVHPDHKPHPRYLDPAFRLGFARLVTHYWRHAAWLAEDQILNEIGRIATISGRMIHGRLDIGGPLVTPWRLAGSWPASTLTVVGAAGHDARDPGMTETVVDATDHFRPTRSP